MLFLRSSGARACAATSGAGALSHQHHCGRSTVGFGWKGEARERWRIRMEMWVLPGSRLYAQGPRAQCLIGSGLWWPYRVAMVFYPTSHRMHLSFRFWFLRVPHMVPHLLVPKTKWKMYLRDMNIRSWEIDNDALSWRHDRECVVGC